MEPRDAAVVVDSDVLSYISKRSEVGSQYWELLDGRQIAISQIVIAELEAEAVRKSWGNPRLARLADFRAAAIELEFTSGVTDKFPLVAETARTNRIILSDNDKWNIAFALTYELPFMTNDQAAARLATALDVEVLHIAGA